MCGAYRYSVCINCAYAEQCIGCFKRFYSETNYRTEVRALDLKSIH